MKRKYLWVALSIVGLLAFVLVFEFGFARGSRPYSSDLNQLRAQFNEDTGKVRLLLLLSPT